MKRILILSLILFTVFSTAKSQVRHTDSMDVTNYSINLNIVHLSKKTLKGYTDMQVLTQSTQQKNLYFDLLELTVDSVIVEGSSLSFQYNDTLLSIPSTPALNLQDTLNVRVYYHGSPVVESANWGGFHFLGDSSLAYNLGVAFAAQPHNYGRVWYPCVDNFTDRATYDFHIRTKQNMMAVCSGSLDSVSMHQNTDKTWHWSLKQTIPTYLSSVAVSDFAIVQDNYSGIEQNIPVFLHVAPHDSADAIGSFTNLNAILSTYEQAFGPYRWPRVGYVGTVKGAMEHATSIAYPRHCIDGTLNCESLLAHELSHHWFGDLVTCKTAEDMWLNEGWAVFCEAIYKEGVYGKTAYRDYMRAKLHEVVQTAHITDNGYRALYGIPHEYTYGATVYDKGATVVHSLRNHLGDSLFFATTKAYLDSFAYSHASTDDFNKFINDYSGINVDGFFDAWVYRPGFSHFAVDSFVYHSSPAQFNTEVYVKQRLLGTSQMANNNRLQLGFLMDNQQIIYKDFSFSGSDTVLLYNLPSMPLEVMMDPEEHISDATTDFYTYLKSTGLEEFFNTYAEVDVQSIQDSAFLRITHNWIPVDDSVNVKPALYHLSRSRYWKVEGSFPAGFHAKGKFEYRKFGNLDGDLINSVFDSLAILYKKERSDSWRPVSFTQAGSAYSGKLIVDSLKSGYYVLARFDESLGMANPPAKQPQFSILPNPAREVVRVRKNVNAAVMLRLYNSQGQLLSINYMDKYEIEKQISINGFESGVYFIQITSEKTGFEEVKKLLIKQ